MDVDDAAERRQLPLQVFVHRTQPEMALDVSVEVENGGNRLLFAVAADIAVKRQVQFGAFTDREFLARLRTVVVADVWQSVDDAIQSAWWHQHVNRAARAVPAVQYSQTVGRRCKYVARP